MFFKTTLGILPFHFRINRADVLLENSGFEKTPLFAEVSSSTATFHMRLEDKYEIR